MDHQSEQWAGKSPSRINALGFSSRTKQRSEMEAARKERLRTIKHDLTIHYSARDTRLSAYRARTRPSK